MSFDEILDRMVGQDPRYRREAYFFIREALDYTLTHISPGKKDEQHHVTGQELLEGLRQCALDQFGPMAKTVLNDWGVHACEDFGELVFNMVEQHLLSKTDQDSRDDFRGGYEFDDAFCKPFRPTKPKPAPVPETKPSQHAP